MTPDLTIKGGSLATPEGVVVADLASADGVITALGQLEGRGRVVDATGLLVLPGMVDTHVHLMDPGPTEREDFPTGTRAAAARGVTTVVEHTHAHPVRNPADLAAKREHLVGRSNVDYGLAAHVWPEDIAGMPVLWRAGVVFFKLFTCTTHGVPGLSAAELLGALTALAKVDGRALVHCEDESITAMAERALRQAGRHDPDLLIEWRSRRAEISALTMVGALAAATGAAITFAHVSSGEAVTAVQTARRWGADAAAEACPQYLALDESEIRSEGALRKFTPPARSRNDDERDEMWRALRNGSLTHVATDHAPSTLEQKLEGDIWEAPFGLPGLDTTYPFMIDAALAWRPHHRRGRPPLRRYPRRALRPRPRQGADPGRAPTPTWFSSNRTRPGPWSAQTYCQRPDGPPSRDEPSVDAPWRRSSVAKRLPETGNVTN